MTLAPHADTRFDSLALSAATLENLRRLGYIEMTAVQAASLPDALQGRDVIAQAKTGSGKTAAFSLALLASWTHAAWPYRLWCFAPPASWPIR